MAGCQIRYQRFPIAEETHESRETNNYEEHKYNFFLQLFLYTDRRIKLKEKLSTSNVTSLTPVTTFCFHTRSY